RHTMADDLTFMMGKYAARLPGELLYARNHMWCRPMGNMSGSRRLEDSPAGLRLRFGFTTYAVRLMQDVYFLDWHVSTGDALSQLQEMGHIETSKATADLFSPIAGTLLGFNADLLKDPSGINVDCHRDGWLFELAGDSTGLMSPEEYHKFL